MYINLIITTIKFRNSQVGEGDAEVDMVAIIICCSTIGIQIHNQQSRFLWQTYTYIHGYMHGFLHTYIHTYIHIYIYIYIYIYTTLTPHFKGNHRDIFQIYPWNRYILWQLTINSCQYINRAGTNIKIFEHLG